MIFAAIIVFALSAQCQLDSNLPKCQSSPLDVKVEFTDMICPEGKVKDAGLCYKPCPDGYKGVGPVCWKGIKAHGRGVGTPMKPICSQGAIMETLGAISICSRQCPEKTIPTNYNLDARQMERVSNTKERASFCTQDPDIFNCEL